jgi:hypothetical protein
MYYGRIDLSKLQSSEILELLLPSDELGLQPLVSYIQEILINNHREFIIKNFIEIIELTYQKNSCNKLWNLCLRQICDNPDYLFESNKFFTFDPTILETLLKRDDLNISKEIIIWENLLKWAREQNPIIQNDINKWEPNDFIVMERRLNRFIPLIRFHYMSSEDFRLKVYPFKDLLPNNLINEVFSYQKTSNKKLIINCLPPRCASTIIKSQHFAVFASWIDKKDSFHYNINNIPYDFKLIYRASRDGETITAFHEACDNKGPTVVITKIKNSEEIVGGYNPFMWNKSGSWKSTKDSFLFTFKNSLNIHSLKIGYSKGDKYSIHCGSGYGPLFGIGIDLGCNADGTWMSNTSTSYSKISIPSYFLVDDYEVFQVVKKTI